MIWKSIFCNDRGKSMVNWQNRWIESLWTICWPHWGRWLAVAHQPDQRPVVLNRGPIEPQKFGESVSGVRLQEILSNKSKKNRIPDAHTLFFQLWRVWWMHLWNLWGSVPPTRLRTIGIDIAKYCSCRLQIFHGSIFGNYGVILAC